jgi:hypothetical protein
VAEGELDLLGACQSRRALRRCLADRAAPGQSRSRIVTQSTCVKRAHRRIAAWAVAQDFLPPGIHTAACRNSYMRA